MKPVVLLSVPGACLSSFLQPPEVASKPPGAPTIGPKATPQNQFSEHDKTLYRWVRFVVFVV